MNSNKDELLIASLKYFVENSGDQLADESDPLELQQSIKSKKQQIQELCFKNLPVILDHYSKFYSLKGRQKELDIQCGIFNKKVQVILNQFIENQNFDRIQQPIDYDQSQHDQEYRQSDGKISHIEGSIDIIQDFVTTARKAVKAIEDQKYTNSIRCINKLKISPITKQESPLTRIFQVFRTKIQQHIGRLFNSFGLQCQRRYLEIGTGCFNKIYQIDKQKQQIYQKLFMPNSRNSMMKSNLYVSQLLVEDNPRASLAMSVIRPEKHKKGGKINPTFVRIKLEVQCLKQAEFIYNQLNEQQKFKIQLKQHGRIELSKLQKRTQDTKIQLKQFLTELIGFLMVRRQLNGIFKLQNELHLLSNQILLVIKNRCKKLKDSKSQDIVAVRETLTVFLQVLQFLQIQTEDGMSESLFKQLFKLYGSDKREEYQKMFEETIKQDNQKKYQTYSQEEYIQLRRMLNLPEIEDFKSYEFEFTVIIPYLVNLFSTFFTDSLQFLGNEDEEGQIHIQLEKLFLILLHSFAKYALLLVYPLLVCQCLVNINYLQKIFRHFSQKLDLEYQIVRLKQFTYKEVLQKVKVELTLKIREMIEQKLEQLMVSCSDIEWAPNQPIKSHNQFLDWLMGYLRANISQIALFKLGLEEQLIYTIVGFINKKYWDILQTQVSSFNLIGIYNLNVDLVFLFSQINSNFYQYKNLADKLKQIRQFVDLMLTGNLNDLFDPVKKRILYSDINLGKLQTVLNKYQRNNHKVVRELKKKQIDVIIQRIEEQNL